MSVHHSNGNGKGKWKGKGGKSKYNSKEKERRAMGENAQGKRMKVATCACPLGWHVVLTIVGGEQRLWEVVCVDGAGGVTCLCGWI